MDPSIYVRHATDLPSPFSRCNRLDHLQSFHTFAAHSWLKEHAASVLPPVRPPSEAGDFEAAVASLDYAEIPLRPARRLYLEYISVAGNHLVKHRIDEESEEEPGDQTCHNDDREGFLSV